MNLQNNIKPYFNAEKFISYLKNINDNKLILGTLIISCLFIFTGILTNNHERNIDELTQVSSDQYTDVSSDDTDSASNYIPNYNVEDLPSDIRNELADLLTKKPNLQILTPVYYVTEDQETIADILSQYHITDSSIDKLVKMDSSLKKDLSADSSIYFISDIQGNIIYLDWRDTPKSHKIFVIQPSSLSDNIVNQYSFSYIEKKISLLILTKRITIAKRVESTLHNTLAKLGLSNSQSVQVSNALKFQVNLNKLPQNAIIQLIVDQEFVEDKPIRNGIKSISAINLNVGTKNYYSFRVGNSFQHANAQANVQSFARIPLLRSARITSGFSLSRRNPVTGKVSPHYGVDFGISSGTPIIAPANGVVQKVSYQANGAGIYLIIKHDSTYTTVYMHLNRTLVKVGDKIKKGQRIAQSGNTGRSSGPHLHYEVHVNGVPRNPMTVKLPTISTITTSQERQLKTIKVAAEKTFTENLKAFKASNR